MSTSGEGHEWTGSPNVSVVVPTFRRPRLVLRAVRSVLAQTVADLEVVVVIDGPDGETRDAIANATDDRRVRVLELPQGRGGSGARNAGIAAARGAWLAFLDDDDEWLPGKLAAQLRAAELSGAEEPLVACQIIGRTPRGDYVWPRRLPRPGEPTSEYLFARSGLFQGEALVQTSMLLARRALVERVGFREGLRRHQDWDWVLRATTEGSASLVFVPEALAIWHTEEERASVSAGLDWRYSLDWLEAMGDAVTARARAAFVLVVAGSMAAELRERGAFLPLLYRAFQSGRPRPIDLLLYFGLWVIPRPVRRRLRAAVERVRGR